MNSTASSNPRRNKIKSLLRSLFHLGQSVLTLGGCLLLLRAAQISWSNQEPTHFVPPQTNCSLRLPSTLSVHLDKSTEKRSCFLGQLVGQDTGEQRWRVTIQPASDRATVIELLNQVTGERGRYEVQCSTQQTALLAFKRKGEAEYTRSNPFTPIQTSMEKLPKEFEQQLLKLCPAEPKAERQRK